MHDGHHTTLQVEAGGIRMVVEHLRSLDEPLWSEHIHLLELNGEFALVKEGNLVSVFRAPAAASPDHVLLQEGKLLIHDAPGPSRLLSAGYQTALISDEAISTVYIGQRMDWDVL